MAVEKKGFFSF